MRVSGLYGVVGFFGQILLGIASLIRHPSRFPVRALVHQMELVGVSALPIIGLMSFLIGIVIAQQGSVQLQQFGAESLTVNLVGPHHLARIGRADDRDHGGGPFGHALSPRNWAR